MKTKILFSAISIIFIHAAYAQNWSITGNNGTNPSLNFLGTKDAQPLLFRVNNIRAGYIDHNINNANLAFGYGALLINSSGQFGSAFGSQALYNNTTGYGNSAFGGLSLLANSTGSYNTALGGKTLPDNNGSFNTAAGYASMFENTTGERNAAFGYKSLAKNTEGYNNTAVGNMSLYSNATGYKNTASGDSALFYNITGYKNTATGAWALQQNTIGNFNTAFGYTALKENSKGNQNTAVGTGALYFTKTSNNTSMGYISLYSNTLGKNNSGFGSSTMYYNGEGSYNSAFGGFASLYNTSGSNNAAFGYNALLWASGSNNTGLGANADLSISNLSNVTVVGANAVGTASNQVRIGNSSVISIGGYANWTTISDGRVKKNIKDNVPGLDFINKLKPVTYNLNLNQANTISKTERKDHEKKIIPFTEQEQKAIKEKEQIIYTGFIAQEVEAAAKEMNYNFSGVDAPKNDQDLYGIRYAEFVAPLVKAVQELSRQKNSQEIEMEELKQQNSMLLERLDKLEKSMFAKSTTVQTTENTLEQNTPNGFTGSTIIRYHIPLSATDGQIVITNNAGTVIKTISLTVKGSSSVIFNSNGFAAGTYYYSLVVNGKKTDSKKMILMK